MTSRTSFYNATILKKNLSRFWPFMALCAFIGFLLLPASMETYDNYSVVGSIGTRISHVLPLLIFGYAPVCAACVFGYLHKPRSSNMLHALPITRNSLFVSNLLSGLLLFLLPWLAICLITLFILAGGGLDVCIVLSIFAVGSMEFLFFYALAVFCMFLCGKTAYSVLTYQFLNFVVFFTEGLIVIAVEPFLFGINVNTEWGTLSEFSPLVYFMENTIWGFNDKISFYANFPDVNLYCDWGYLGILSAVGIVLLALAWLLYRKRNMENVGEAVAYPRLRPVFRIVLAFFSALALGLLITSITFSEGVSENTATGMHLAMLIGGFIGYFGVEMILRKTTRVFQGKTFLGYSLFAVALWLMLFGVRFDWLNIVGYIPESEHVVIRYNRAIYDASPNGITLTDPESIDAFRSIHQKIIDDHTTANYCGGYRLEIVYDLGDGDFLERAYFISPTYQAEIHEELIDFFYTINPALFYVDTLQICDTCRLYIKNSADGKEYSLNSTFFAELCAAMKLDARNGTLWTLNMELPSTPTQGYIVSAETRQGEAPHTCIEAFFIPQSEKYTNALIDTLLGIDSDP